MENMEVLNVEYKEDKIPLSEFMKHGKSSKGIPKKKQQQIELSKEEKEKPQNRELRGKVLKTQWILHNKRKREGD